MTGSLRDLLAAEGPIAVDRFMAEALGHPQWGYYRRQDPLGLDFTTSPEISQVFGELIGVWAAVVWQQMGCPDPFVLAELGPGRGTLMADALRAVAAMPGFVAAARIHLVETSPALRERQRAALADRPVAWHDDVDDLPLGPTLVIANEFFDALPVRQFVKRREGWRERLVVWRDDRFAFVDGEIATIAAPAAIDGAVFEINEAARRIVAGLGRRIAAENGVALIVDYGHPRSAAGDTLQAVHRNRRVPPLENPGDADLTTHVDFEALAQAAWPAHATDVVTQAAFLGALNIGVRAERLKSANPGQAADIDAGCRRLIDPAGMGTLFKAMAIAHPSLPPLPGFVR